MRPGSKYPFAEMEIGDSFFVSDPKDMHCLSVAKTVQGQKLKRVFPGRKVTAEWAREHNIPVPHGVTHLYGIWRER